MAWRSQFFHFFFFNVDIDADRQTEDKKPLKCGYGEEWKRSAGLIKLLMRKCSGEQTKTGKY